MDKTLEQFESEVKDQLNKLLIQLKDMTPPKKDDDFVFFNNLVELRGNLMLIMHSWNNDGDVPNLDYYNSNC